MFTFEGIDGNLKLLIVEVEKQLEAALQAIENHADYSEELVLSREDYIDYLSNTISKKCYRYISLLPHENRVLMNSITAFGTISRNLERIGDFLVNITKQTYFFKDKNFIKGNEIIKYFHIINRTLPQIFTAFFNNDINKARELCVAEERLDELYYQDFNRIKNELEKNEKNTGDLLTSLFIFRYLERIGDAMLNIGEAVITSVIGTKVKLGQYEAMLESLDTNDDDFIIENIGGETRSGCRIEKLKNKPNSENKFEVIFKEGKKKKISEEKCLIDKWNQLFPGLVPKIYTYEEKDMNASLLMEFLIGKNFQEILAGDNEVLIQKAFTVITETLKNVWITTYEKKSVSANFILQLQKRLRDVYKLHPSFKKQPLIVKNVKYPPLEELLEKAKGIERNLSAPFSVLIHGDLNNDNILYDETTNTIRFIDLHRSRQMDYLQDLSVFIVSNIRLPLFDQRIRQRITKISIETYNFAKNFALQQNDTTFDARLSLGLARSMITSTRFSIREQFARKMFVRAIHLLKQIVDHVDHNEPLENFKFNFEIFNY